MARQNLGIDPIDLAFRALAAVVTAWFVYRLGNGYWHQPERVTILLLLISELASLLTILLSRRPSIRDLNPAYMVLTVTASFIIPLFVEVDGTSRLLPEVVSSAVILLGGAWTIYAKLSLGRSFGLLAAQRVIKVRGAYRFVRHPIYAGYFLIHIGYLASNCNRWNLCIIAIFYMMQILRALREEKILSRDEAYRAYCQTTKYRFLYGII